MTLIGKSEHKLHVYMALCRDPSTGREAEFVITALTEGNADVQARDGFFGLLGVDPERRAALQVDLFDYGEAR